ncbi:Na+/H+ antiporter subunit D [Paenibacillus turpanensis]|uniref:Na+/H+ antiporter subunit D n=1 Tax=Paenibacillus turpanensis TaxID=2689078 RepID=UPI00140ABC8C|nr:Na+/H+ antiporter subunit D [Paenibacillus turpanensis]
MNNTVVIPLLIPLVTAIILIFSNGKRASRWISGASALLNIAVSAYLVYEVQQKGIQTLHMGGWAPPYGIIFVADMLAALLVLTTAVIGAACLFYAFRSIGEEREKHYFYTFVQFLLVGVIGSFLTGDIFNLFVCFEVMLIASYALITLGGKKLQLRESLKYILINIVSSILFVASMAYLYAVVGTLNMAHLSVRVAEAGQSGVLDVIAVLFLIVFSLKAGLFLFYWLPGSYLAPPAAILALFGGLLTKVGMYAIIRTFTLIFHDTGGIVYTLIGWMAVGTMVLGGIGAVAYRDVNRVLIYNIVISIGFISFGLAAANQAALEGVVFYLVHDMIAKTLLFLLGGALIAAAGTGKLKEMGGYIQRYPALGWMFLVAAMAIVGVPPLSGFIGKLLIVEGGLRSGHYLMTGIALLSSLFVLYSMIKLFMGAFWGKPRAALSSAKDARIAGLLTPAALLLVLVIAIGLGAEWMYGFAARAGEVLLQPQFYVEAVLKG